VSTPQDIEALLDAEIHVAQRLASALEKEREVLVGASPEAVAAAANTKAALLGEFEQLENKRRRLYAESGLHASADTASSASSTGIIGLTSGIAHRWQSLMGLIAACRDANQTNGLIVNLRRGQVRQLIDIVRGKPGMCYGPQGQTFAKAVRPLARA
jgi:flagellar biosynthesis protein FlgN